MHIRKTTSYRKGNIIDVEEYYRGKNGAPGMPRNAKTKKTNEAMKKVNHKNKTKRCRQKLLTYFDEGDYFVTLTYSPEYQPISMAVALDNFKKMIRIIRREYKKAGKELYWIRNIECSPNGVWHIHLVINRIDKTKDIIRKAWGKYGATNIRTIHLTDNFYDKDFSKLSDYMTKDPNTSFQSDDLDKVKESDFGSSRNTKIPEPEIEQLDYWEEEVAVEPGYYCINQIDMVNPVIGYRYRRYTKVRL